MGQQAVAKALADRAAARSDSPFDEMLDSNKPLLREAA